MLLHANAVESKCTENWRYCYAKAGNRQISGYLDNSGNNGDPYKRLNETIDNIDGIGDQ